jgi:TM2 domain-containing membrane protein YozV
MSKKRILPAVILAGTVGFMGAHRMYAGRWYTGLAQLALFSAGFVMLKSDLAGIGSIQSLDQYLDWMTTHTIRPLPALLAGAPVFWALYDCILLMARSFKDGAGNVMTAWV